MDELNVKGFKKTGVIMQGFDILDVANFVGRLNKRYQAVLLSNIEDVLGKSHKDYPQIRKLILDSTNNFTRAVMNEIFGEIE
jgi:lauroyl/myristoyl acyltransferase